MPSIAPGERYRTHDGDSVDAICWRYYGRQAGAVERVLDANPGLAAAGPVLPEGMEVVLPELDPELPEASTVSLWD